MWVSNEHTRHCSSIKGKELKRSPIDVINIEGLNNYRIGAEALTLEQLNALLLPFEVEAQENQCKYTLRFDAPDSVSQKTALRAERAIHGKFYTLNQ